MLANIEGTAGHGCPIDADNWRLKMAQKSGRPASKTEIEDLRAQLAGALQARAGLEAQLEAYRQESLQAVEALSAEREKCRMAEQAWRETKDQYRRNYEASLDAIFLTSADGGILVSNPAAGRMFGYTEREFRQLGCAGVADAQDPRLASAIAERARTGRFRPRSDPGQKRRNAVPRRDLERHLHCPGRRSANHHCHSRQHRNQVGRRGAQAQTLLLSESQRIAHLGSWELDLAANHLAWSDEVYRLFGVQPHEFAATYEAFLACVHPDDRALVDGAYWGSLREAKDNHEIEHRLVKKDTGEVRAVLERCVHVSDASGKIVRSIGIVPDVTNRKRAEAAVVRSEARLRGILAHCPDTVMRSTSAVERRRFSTARFSAAS